MKDLRKAALMFGWTAALGLLLNACDKTPPPGEEELITGTLQAALSIPGPTHDVGMVYFKVVEADAGCDGEAILDATEPLEEEALPAWVEPEGGGEAHPFADALFVLPPGTYRVCAFPLTADGKPSEECEPAESLVTVIPEATTEILLVMQCDGDPNGGLDIIATLNDPPLIDGLNIKESKFITICERAEITVTAFDPNGDALSYAWSIVTAPSGASPTLSASGSSAVFSTDTPGDYELKVVVTDVYGSSASLTFPIHVSYEDCGEDPCSREINPQCEPKQCDDGDPNTFNDACRYTNNDECVCAGDTANDPCSREINPQCEPKQCDDGDPNTFDDVCRFGPNGACECAGEPEGNECSPDVNPKCEPKACDDGDPDTQRDTCAYGPNGECMCIGDPADDPCSLEFNPQCDPKSCDDGNPKTIRDMCRSGLDGDCWCAGDPEDNPCNLEFNPQCAPRQCDDGNPDTLDDICRSGDNGACTCIGDPADDPCGSVLNPQCRPDECDDGDPNTYRDICRYGSTDKCMCIGSN